MNFAVFAAVFVTLYTAHHVGDQWVQTHRQSLTKGDSGWAGRLACARHVAGYTATAVVLLTATAALLSLPVTLLGVTLGQAVSAVTHYWADRRSVLRRFAKLIGKDAYYHLGAPRPDLPAVSDRGGPIGATVPHDNVTIGTGAYALDQSFHVFWIFVATLITTLVR
jgi:hypothetical protein